MKGNALNLKKLIAIPAVLVLALSFASCSASGGEGSAAEAATDAAAGAGDGYYDMEDMDPSAIGESVAESPSVASVEADSFAGGGTGTAASAAQIQESAGSAAHKITFSASFTLNTKNFDEDYQKINKLVGDAGGYIASENSDGGVNSYNQSYGRTTTMSLRVPVAKYDGLVSGLEGVGELVNKQKSSEDLTDSYFDTEARIQMLEMRRDRLVGYLETATVAEDIIVFEQELSQVLYELDQYQGSLRKMDNLVDYATVDLSLYELITPETIGPDGEPLGDRASQAMSLSATGVKEFLENAAVFFAGAAPVIGLIAVIAICAWFIRKLVKRLLAKYREKHPKKEKPGPWRMNGPQGPVPPMPPRPPMPPVQPQAPAPQQP
ncbi:MAG: DUF4349 domain-containing protein [Clostridiales Family XIII bacterium]|jgi:hypothetical protein|nr:DUF4349 domain-containing protein [Clostridiales Family XIII bacterium]